MAAAKTKTATVSTPPKATVSITVRFKTTNAAVVGAKAAAGVGKGALRDLGKTNASGQLKNVKFDPGLVEITLFFQNHRGEGLPQTTPESLSTTTIFKGTLNAGDVQNIDVLMIQVISQVTLTIVDSVSNQPLAGTKVTGASTGSANRNGQFVSGPLSIGLLHTFSAVHAGFGPPSGSVEGPVSASLDLRTATSVSNSTLQISMNPIFGKVKSSKITVEGDDFPVFYQKFIQGFPLMHPTIRIHKSAQLSFPAPGRNFNIRGFKKLFDDLAKWAGANELTIEEFVAIFLIFANETGGAFTALAEKGSLSYLFYLNKPSNRSAGDQLLERGIISDPELVKAWNAVGIPNGKGGCSNFPGTSPSGPTDADIAECDFNKFRGRGYVQLTFVDINRRFLQPALLAAGLPGIDVMTTAELDDAVLNNEAVFTECYETTCKRCGALGALRIRSSGVSGGLPWPAKATSPTATSFSFAPKTCSRGSCKRLAPDSWTCNEVGISRSGTGARCRVELELREISAAERRGSRQRCVYCTAARRECRTSVVAGSDSCSGKHGSSGGWDQAERLAAAMRGRRAHLFRGCEASVVVLGR